MIPVGVLEMQLSGDGSWTDVTQWWAITPGWDIKRGRSHELDTYPVTSFTFTLVNDDGRFTPGNPSSPYFPNVVRGRGVRLTMTFNGLPGWNRFTGTVVSEPVHWDTIQTLSYVTITAHDIRSQYAKRRLRSTAVETVCAMTLAAYWPLTDSKAPAMPVAGASMLNPVQYGTGGELAWGGGVGPVTDAAGALMLKPVDAANGVMLVSDVLPATVSGSFTLLVVANPLTDGTLVQISWGSYALGIRYSGGVFQAVEQTTDGAGQPIESVLSSDPGVGISTRAVMMQVNFDRVSMVPGAMGALRAAQPSQPFRISVGGALVRPAGPDMVTATVSHVAVIEGTPSGTLRDSILGRMTSDLVTVMKAVLGWARLPQYVRSFGAIPQVVMPQVAGKTVEDIFSGITAATGGRIFINRVNQPLWMAPDFTETAVPLDLEDISPDVRWETDDSTVVRSATMSLVGGGTYTASRDIDGQDVSLTGIYAADVSNRGRADWLVAQDASPRLTPAQVDLMAMPDDATTASIALLDIGSLIAPTSVPPQISSGVLVVEGCDEHGSASDWTLTLKTSPWPYGEALTIDDPTYGALDQWRVI